MSLLKIKSGKIIFWIEMVIAILSILLIIGHENELQFLIGFVLFALAGFGVGFLYEMQEQIDELCDYYNEHPEELDETVDERQAD